MGLKTWIMNITLEVKKKEMARGLILTISLNREALMSRMSKRISRKN